jgi:thiamine-phosphate pyrophosphorylase
MARNLSGLFQIANQLNQQCRLRFGSNLRFLPSLILMSDDVRLPDPGPSIRALPEGSAIIFRHYNDPRKEELAAKYRQIAKDHKIIFLLAGDPRSPTQAKPDGYHLPEHLLDLAQDLRATQPNIVLTAAAHSNEAVTKAALAGVDAVLLSPLFATESHVDAKPLGPHLAREIAKNATIPVYGLGGINAQTAPLLIESHLAGFAAIGALAK